jgi:GNAT superfamily N-acetyltransferase
MSGVLPQPLIDLALRPWGRPRVGVIVDRTPERIVELQPSFPIPGPNHAALVRCAPERVAALVEEVRALAASHGLPCMWILDPDVRPTDLPERLAACGIQYDDETVVMVLPASADLAPGRTDVEIVDALRDAATFALAEDVQVAAFGADLVAGQAQRFEEARADSERHFYLAMLDGEPAGAAWATVHEAGVLMNGGAVTPRFQGRGVYRALLSERLALARRLGLPGIGTHARPDTSGPILERLGFVAVGRHLMYD